MINNDMYSLCIDINNKLFRGKLHFASCQVWSIKVICKDFTWKYRAENLTTHLHLNYCLRANPLEFLSCSRQNCHYMFLVILIHKFLVPFQHWNILRGGVDFDANSDRNFKATLYERGSAILRINYRYFGIAEYWSRQCASKYDPFFPSLLI